MLHNTSSPFWKGPKVDGITQSMINAFDCPYRAYLSLILGYEDDLPLHPNLIWGDCYHVGLEHMIQDFSNGVPRQEYKINAQIKALERLQHHEKKENTIREDLDYDSYKGSIPWMLTLYDLTLLPEGPWVTEQVFDVKIEGYRFKGKMDGIQEGQCLLEHKCKRFNSIDPTLLSEELHTDLQVNLYMKVAEVEKVQYDLIGIPESVTWKKPYKAKNVPSKEYAKSLVLGGAYARTDMFPIKYNTHVWFSQRPYIIPEEDQYAYWKKTIIPRVKRIEEWYEYVTDPTFDPNNPSCYNSTFYIEPVRRFQASNTEKFKCDFHAVLTGQDDLTSLRKKRELFPELKDTETSNANNL